MQYSPKLKKAMEEIKSILEKNDIGASVILHTPGHGEFMMNIGTSYSCAFFEGDTLRIRAKLLEDFNGDKDAWLKKVNDTTNMLITFLDCGNTLNANMLRTLTMLKKKIEIERFDGGMTGHTQQNN